MIKCESVRCHRYFLTYMCIKKVLRKFCGGTMAVINKIQDESSVQHDIAYWQKMKICTFSGRQVKNKDLKVDQERSLGWCVSSVNDYRVCES